MSQSLSKTKVINANFNELAAEKHALKKPQKTTKRKEGVLR